MFATWVNVTISPLSWLCYLNVNVLYGEYPGGKHVSRTPFVTTDGFDNCQRKTAVGGKAMYHLSTVLCVLYRGKPGTLALIV